MAADNMVKKNESKIATKTMREIRDKQYEERIAFEQKQIKLKRAGRMIGVGWCLIFSGLMSFSLACYFKPEKIKEEMETLDKLINAFVMGRK